MKDNDDRLIESVAEAMWQLIGYADYEKDWKWCCENEPATAWDLRFRARCAVVRSTIPSPLDVKKTSQPKLDLSFKKAFVGDDKNNQE